MNDLNFKQRYARQISIPEIGKEGQHKLSESKVLIIGCGALGSMVAMQLSGAGIGELGIADYDNIEVSNLQRQFFFKSDECGRSKSDILSDRIKELNPSVKVTNYNQFITKPKAEELFVLYDIIIDATDNPDSKRLIDEIALKHKKPCIIGGVKDFSGQVITLLPTDMRFEEYFGKASQEAFMPCSLGGVIGPAAALCASVQASEAIKCLLGIGKLLSGRLFVFNLLTANFSVFSLFSPE